MPQASPPARPPTQRDQASSQDRITWIVRGTLLALLVIGVLTVFGDSLLGLAGESRQSPPTAPEPSGSTAGSSSGSSAAKQAPGAP
jgi:hypothetical protein